MMDHLTSLVVGDFFKISVIVPIEYLLTMHDLPQASRIVRNGLLLNIWLFLAGTLRFDPETITSNHCFTDHDVIATPHASALAARGTPPCGIAANINWGTAICAFNSFSRFCHGYNIRSFS